MGPLYLFSLSEPETRDQRLSELKDMLLLRQYKVGVINAAIERAKAGRKLLKESWNPKLQKDQYSLWDTILPCPVSPKSPKNTGEQWLRILKWETSFRNHLLVADMRPQTIRNKLIRAKVPSKKPKKVMNGMFKCKKICKICPYVKTCKQALDV